MSKQIDFTKTNGGITIASKITNDELSLILEIIKQNFGAEPFKNKDLSFYLKDLSARQIPSRLRKMVDNGDIEDLGGNPKSYRLIQ